MNYTDQQRENLAQKEYNRYSVDSRVRLDNGTVVSCVAQMVQMPGGLDGCAPADRMDEYATRRITFSANFKNTPLHCPKN